MDETLSIRNTSADEKYSLTEIRDILCNLTHIHNVGGNLTTKDTYQPVNLIVNQLGRELQQATSESAEEIRNLYLEAVALWTFSNTGVLVRNISPLVGLYYPNIKDFECQSMVFDIIDASRVHIISVAERFDCNQAKFITFAIRVVERFTLDYLRNKIQYAKNLYPVNEIYLEELLPGDMQWEDRMMFEGICTWDDEKIRSEIQFEQMWKKIDDMYSENKLSKAQYQALAMVHVSGYTPGEAAKRLNEQRQTFHIRYKTALGIVRKELNPDTE